MSVMDTIDWATEVIPNTHISSQNSCGSEVTSFQMGTDQYVLFCHIPSWSAATGLQVDHIKRASTSSRLLLTNVALFSATTHHLQITVINRTVQSRLMDHGI